jgi:uncharacterized protein YutE (UPF0331/DUF86 family)
MGIPTSTADSFSLLAAARVIDRELATKLISVVGFRNIAVRQYEDPNLDIVQAVIETGLDDLPAFTDAVLRYLTA